jgi:hypothetical protein
MVAFPVLFVGGKTAKSQNVTLKPKTKKATTMTNLLAVTEPQKTKSL